MDSRVETVDLPENLLQKILKLIPEIANFLKFESNSKCTAVGTRRQTELIPIFIAVKQKVLQTSYRYCLLIANYKVR